MLEFHVDVPHVFGAVMFGLFLGSALNMVVSRLPVYMQLQWQTQGLKVDPELPEVLKPTKPKDGFFRSYCPHCQSELKLIDQVPILSFALLRGKCRYCAQALSWRYPLVELTTGLLLAACVVVWGVSWQAFAAASFASCLFALALIDWDASLLPDVLTQPLLWAGLIVSALRVSQVPLDQSLAGAVLGYLFMWIPYVVYKLLTGKEGMGHGDFKLTAAMGAWLGVGGLLPVILFATLTGAIFGLIKKISGSLGNQGYFPFGPFLAMAGVLVLFGDSI